ncbi:MAG TPA: LuxR C-terminal-related transcriptional regulator [Thermomicrobiales bacterium]|nr:LuxR C-terminal-related transcriptional regulator [Thermomicrobiales bacterium]
MATSMTPLLTTAGSSSGPRLPTSLTPLIGREQEIAALRAFVLGDGTRLLTLTGPGGSGKTRLAQQLAIDLGNDFAAGSRFISLASVTEPEHLLQAIAVEMGIREEANRSLADLVPMTLRQHELLIVLDNFEQLVEAAPVVSLLLGQCLRLAIIVTSRVPLHVQGEQEYPVPPLALPGAQRAAPVEELASCAAIALFIARARSVDPGFVLDERNAQTVAEICLRLDGLPLAIELAAARMKILSAEALLARLANRLRILIGGARDLPARQRTLRDTISWSYDLLSPDEQALFRRLAVFHGGFTLDGAAAVAGDIDALDGVGSLVDKSLLRRADAAGMARFTMLETIREFALELLMTSDEAADVQRSHATWYAELAEDARTGIYSSEQRVWLDCLEVEHDNLRAAMTFAAEHNDNALLLRFTAVLGDFWTMRGHFSEGHGWLKRAVMAGSANPSPALAQTLSGAAIMSTVIGEPDAARQFAEDGLRVARLTGDGFSIGIALFCCADVAEEVGDQNVAVDTYLQAAEVFRSLEEWVLLALTLANVGATCVSLHRYDEAIPPLQEALELSTTHLFDLGIGMCSANLSRIEWARGDLVAARDHSRQSLQVWLVLGDQMRIVRLLERMAAIAAADRQPVLATRLLSAAEARFDSFGVARTAGSVQAIDQAIKTIEPQLSREAFAGAWDAGSALSIDEAVAEALAFELMTAPTAPTPATDRSLLSAREQEVVQLLVAGYSDRQIAESLFISHRTAQGHVASIFNKLGVNSRTAAATTAIRLGIVSDGGPPA